MRPLLIVTIRKGGNHSNGDWKGWYGLVFRFRQRQYSTSLRIQLLQILLQLFELHDFSKFYRYLKHLDLLYLCKLLNKSYKNDHMKMIAYELALFLSILYFISCLGLPSEMSFSLISQAKMVGFSLL